MPSAEDGNQQLLQVEDLCGRQLRSFSEHAGLSNVQPPQIPRKERRRYLPHAFTEEELIRFFHECDSIPVINSRKETIIRKMSVPVFFRLLYSSGIRTNEARLLLRENVDLRRGNISSLP